jgi:leader peptidase (prepilin peptidase) / N-methyltransferase
MIIEIFIFLFGLCWGSFLNVLAFRLLHGHEWILKRSFCPKCNKILPWYDLIPVVSWLLLKTQCRFCKQRISWLYPLIELLAGALALLLYMQVKAIYIPAYFIFFSALLVTIRTDLEDFTIFLVMTWALVPISLISSYFGYLPITITESALGIAVGYAVLWFVKKIYFMSTGIEGIGSGDLNLLAMIGSFVGIEGILSTLLAGSFTGLVFGSIYFIFFSKDKDVLSKFTKFKIPFGVFLSIGAIIYTFFPNARIILNFK